MKRNIILFALLFLAGCNAVGAIVYKLTPEPELPAEFTLAKRPTVVIVENYRHPDLAASDAEFLAQRVQEKLMQHDVVPIVRAEKIVELRGKDTAAFRKMTVKQIAAAVEAEQVIYISLEASGFGAMGGSSTIQGKAGVLVKVIDGATGDTVWPVAMSDGKPATFTTNPGDGNEHPNPQDLRYKLYDGLGQRIARLFYKYKASEQAEQSQNG